MHVAWRHWAYYSGSHKWKDILHERKLTDETLCIVSNTVCMCHFLVFYGYNGYITIFLNKGMRDSRDNNSIRNKMWVCVEKKTTQNSFYMLIFGSSWDLSNKASIKKCEGKKGHLRKNVFNFPLNFQFKLPRRNFVLVWPSYEKKLSDWNCLQKEHLYAQHWITQEYFSLIAWKSKFLFVV